MSRERRARTIRRRGLAPLAALATLLLAGPAHAAPATTIQDGPEGGGNETAAVFDFVADDPQATFECALDGGAWTGCDSPAVYDRLAPGSHTFSVRATGSDGAVEASPPRRTWTVSGDDAAPAGPDGSASSPFPSSQPPPSSQQSPPAAASPPPAPSSSGPPVRTPAGTWQRVGRSIPATTALLIRRGARPVVRCSRACTVRAVLRASGFDDATPRTLDRGTASRSSAGLVGVSLRLDPADQRWARRRGTLSVTVRVMVSFPGPA